MNSAKPVKTPLPDTLQLKISDGDPMDDPHLYRQVIGYLQYACLTRPDIAYVVNKLCKYMFNPTTTH
jgi:histone deacetylase 1/2